MAQNKDKHVELMAPLKNLKSLNAVLNSANAIYFGVEDLNMRSFADNFQLKDLAYIVQKCHDNNLKAYLTLNTIVYENEFDLIEKILDKAVEVEIDSIIVHDIGVINLIKKRGLEFHISTQANISNSYSAMFYEQLGAKRLILARELSLDQIKKIKSKVNKAEIETFVHGAQCTSISGRCYFSAEICGAQDYSANRGKCVQPCRGKWSVYDENENEFLYDGVFFINTKDLCMIEHIPELIEANIDAFKIEGRMRDPIYIETVSQCYREAIDAYYNSSFSEQKVEGWLIKLKRVYNRGFSTGFYFGMPDGKEIVREKHGNISEYRKMQIGKVINYFPEKKAAKLLLHRGKLKLGDEIFIIGKNTDTYLHQTISSIQIKKKRNLVETPPISKGSHLRVGITVDEEVKKNDGVYLLTNKGK
ncbi:MAG: putative enzyme [Promethearchaeota archaeon]|nr:MAG: putative enzyme [Candidatus Lokiarchaeota archaeon]